jgi:adenosylcobinamide-phosphate synthase
MLSFGMVDGGEGFDPLILLVVALFLDAYLGDTRMIFRFIKHPVEVIGAMVGFLDRRLNRERRGEMDRAVRGALSVVAVVIVVLFAGIAVAWLSLNHEWGWIIELFLVTTLLAGRSLFDHVKAVARGLSDSLEQGREAVSHIVGRDPSRLDEHGVARAAIESAAENLCDGVVAPVFWYILFGFPGLIIYKAVNTMDSMIGHKTAKYRAFGMTAARLDDVLNIIPARLTGLFFVMGALFVPKTRPLAALKVMLRDSGKHRSMNAGWPEAAVAGALGIALAGPRRYSGRVVDDAWMGDGTAQVTIQHINLALYLYAVTALINVMWVGAIAVIRFSLPG